MNLPEPAREIRNLFLKYVPLVAVFSAGFISTTFLLDFSPYRSEALQSGIWILLAVVTILLMYFIHMELLRKTRFFRSFYTVDPSQIQVITTDIVRETALYPYRFAVSAFIVALGLLIFFHSLFHAFVGSSFSQSLMELFIYLFIFCLWYGPLFILIYVLSEHTIRRLLFRLFTPEQWIRMDFSDIRFHAFSYRIKQAIVCLLPLSCFLIIFALTAYRLSTLFHPLLMVVYGIILGYFILITFLSSSGVQEALVATDAVFHKILRKKNLSADEIQKLIHYTRDEIGSAMRSLFELCVRVIPEMVQMENKCRRQSEQLVDLNTMARNQNAVSYSQASALSELATTMEEIVQSVNQISADAMKTSQMTQQGLNAVQQGRQFLEQTLDSIEQIHQESTLSSQRIMDLSLKMVQIEDVVRIINYVTDHTKILAFNAAIETASAGEIGERFGVVATEIRQLAQHISDSTEEIKKIINDVKKTAHASVITTEKELKQVNLALKTANEAQVVFSDIHSTIEEASNAVNNISSAISQQRLVHEQVWSSIKDIDQSAKELLSKSRQMVDLIGKLVSVSNPS